MKNKIRLMLIFACAFIVILCAVACNTNPADPHQSSGESNTVSSPTGEDTSTDSETSESSGTEEPGVTVEELTVSMAAEYINDKLNMLLSTVKSFVEAERENVSSDITALLGEAGASFTVNKGGMLLDGLEGIQISDNIMSISGNNTNAAGELIPYKNIYLSYEMGEAEIWTEGDYSAVMNYAVYDAIEYEIDWENIEKAFAFSNGSLKKGEKDGEFIISSSYLAGIANAVKEAFSADSRIPFDIEELIPELDIDSVIVNLTEYDKDIIYLLFGEDTSDLKLKLDFHSFDGEKGVISCTAMENTDANVRLDFSIELTENALTAMDFNLYAENDGKKIEMVLQATETLFDFSIRLVEKDKTLLDLSLALAEKTNELALEFSLLVDESLGSDSGVDVKPLSLAAQTPSLSGSADIKGKLSLVFDTEGLPQTLTLSAYGTFDDNSIDLSMNADFDKLNLQGAIVLEGLFSAVNTAGQRASQNITLVTDKYTSDTDASYTLRIEGQGFDGNKNEELATLIVSETVNINCSVKEQKLINALDAFFSNTERAIQMANTCLENYIRIYNNNVFPDGFPIEYLYIKDQTGLFYYVITLDRSGDNAYANVTIAFDDSNFGYFYTECNQYINIIRESQYNKDYLSIKNASVPHIDGYVIAETSDFYVCQYIKDIDMYMVAHSKSTDRFLYQGDPTEKLKAEGHIVHVLTYDKNGNAILHDFEFSHDENCFEYHKCKACGLTRRSIYEKHAFSNETVLRQLSATDTKATFSICGNCNKALLMLEDKNGNKLIMNCNKVSLQQMNEIADVVGTKRYTEEQIKNYLTISSISIEFRNNTVYFPEKLVNIPDISKTGYILVGASGGFDAMYSFYENKLVLPETMIFLTDGALCQASVSPWNEIVFPESMRYIGGLSNCRDIKSLTIPSGVVYLGRLNNFDELEVLTVKSKNLLFFGGVTSNALEKLTFDGTVKEFYGFTACNITSFTLPRGCMYVGEFTGNTSLESIVIPASVKEIYDHAFTNCTALTSVTFEGASLEKIGDMVFSGCTALKSVMIPEVAELGGELFIYCSALKEVIFKGGFETLSANTFGVCVSLNKVVLPEGLKVIGSNAFSSCESLVELVLPDSVEKIDAFAFSSCSSLRKINIPKKLVSIDNQVFWKCPNLVFEEIVFPDTFKRLGDNAFYEIDSIGKIIFNRDIEYIGSSPFSSVKVGEVYLDCTNIKIPSLGCVPDVITYAENTFWERLTQAVVINIHSKVLPTNENPSTVTVLGSHIKTINFAGTAEDWAANAGVMIDPATIVNYNVKFD